MPTPRRLETVYNDYIRTMALSFESEIANRLPDLEIRSPKAKTLW